MIDLKYITVEECHDFHINTLDLVPYAMKGSDFKLFTVSFFSDEWYDEIIEIDIDLTIVHDANSDLNPIEFYTENCINLMNLQKDKYGNYRLPCISSWQDSLADGDYLLEWLDSLGFLETYNNYDFKKSREIFLHDSYCFYKLGSSIKNIHSNLNIKSPTNLYNFFVRVFNGEIEIKYL